MNYAKLFNRRSATANRSRFRLRVTNIFGLGRDVTNPVKIIIPSSSFRTMQNSVTVSRTVCAHVESQKSGDDGDPSSYRMGAWLTVTPTPTCVTVPNLVALGQNGTSAMTELRNVKIRPVASCFSMSVKSHRKDMLKSVGYGYGCDRPANLHFIGR